jgi:hypothetical protein
MNNRIRQALMALVLVLTLTFTAACSTAAPSAKAPDNQGTYSKAARSMEYGELARGDSPVGQNFADWVISTSQGLIKDAYVRDDNKLGAVVTQKVRPNEVKALAQSLVMGFRKNFPDRDLTVLMYAPDRKLIMTARYDTQSRQLEYQAAS